MPMIIAGSLLRLAPMFMKLAAISILCMIKTAFVLAFENSAHPVFYHVDIS